MFQRGGRAIVMSLLHVIVAAILTGVEILDTIIPKK